MTSVVPFPERAAQREPPHDEAAADRANAEILRDLASPNLTVITNGKTTS